MTKVHGELPAPDGEPLHVAHLHTHLYHNNAMSRFTNASDNENIWQQT
jgi:hypothetical protein